MRSKKPKAFMWKTPTDFLVVTPDQCWIAPLGDVEELLKGKRRRVQLKKTSKDTIVQFKLKTQIYRFVVLPHKLLTQEEKQAYRSFGYIPVDRSELKKRRKRIPKVEKPVQKGNRILKFRCDPETEREIVGKQRELGWNQSETIRYLILKGLEYSRNEPEVKLKLDQKLFEALEDHRRLFNMTENLNLSLPEFIQLILERAVGLGNLEENTDGSLMVGSGEVEAAQRGGTTL